MSTEIERELVNLQDNRSLIRTAGGWSTEQFGDMIGVTKQTISNLENRKTTLSKTQYIAIRSVLDYEMERDPSNQLLESTINLCLNSSEELSQENRDKVLAFVSGSKKVGLDEVSIIAGVGSLIGVTLGVIGSMSKGTEVSTWLRKILSSKE